MERALGTWSMGRLGSSCYHWDTSSRRQGVVNSFLPMYVFISTLMYCRVSFNISPTRILLNTRLFSLNSYPDILAK